MTPCSTQSDPTNSGHAQTVISSNLTQKTMIRSNCYNLCISQFGHWMSGSFRTSISMSTLGVHISQIVGLCAEKQMFWAHTCSVVTAVQDASSVMGIFSVWNLAKRQYPRDPMCLEITPIESKLSVSGRAEGSCPQPAFSGFIDLAPKAVLYTLISHARLLSLLVRGAVGTSGPSALRYFSTVVTR